MQRSCRTSRGGFTLVELALVMGLIGLIFSTIWWAASTAREAQRGNDALTEMQMVVQNIDQMMLGQSFLILGNITGQMITAQALPSTYAQTATTANTPWGAGNFYIWALPGNKTFRVSFYNVTPQGCQALLLKGTSCQAGQSGCPSQVGTGGSAAPTSPAAANSCMPNKTCPGGAAAPNLGWQVMNVTAATGLCTANNYTGAGNNSVEFDYSL